MYVKELTIRGFKSFANMTTLRFEPGITAVVGPNGSGKSNIVDALAWVMGEQGVKTLRGTSMEDVIFAGTSSRPPLGRAQVSLTIDNSDGTLDIEYSEVTISRTIFRNGGSEYAINGSPVRLLDIQELLSDTGLGSHMHVVVGQGRLDSILRATPADNRAFIEEAAGILKHRRRKERALRKLQTTQENLDRLDDLLQEIQRQLGPLRRQARVSRRADSIQVALRDAKSRLYADDAVKIIQMRDSIRRDLAQIRSQLSARQQELTETKVEIERLEELTSKSSPAIDAVNQTWHDMSQIEERLASLSALAQERERSWQSRVAPVSGDDPDILRKHADELESQAKEEETRVQDMRLQLDKETEKRAAAEKQLASLRQMIAQLRKSAQERDARVSRIREMLARQEAQKQASADRRADLISQKGSLEKQLAQEQEHAQELQLKHDGPEELTRDELDNARQKAEEARNELDQARSGHRDIESKIISLQAKADALDDTLQARNTSGGLERHKDIETLGRLSAYIRIEEGWEEAVSKALGPFASAVVIPQHDGIAPAMRIAHDEKIGRAVVVAPSDGELRQARSSDPHKGGPHKKGIRPTCSVISINPHAPDPAVAAHVVESLSVLLDDVALADSLDDAISVFDSALGDDDGVSSLYSQIVAASGELVTPVGAIGGLSRSPSDLSLAARRDKALLQCEELKRQAEGYEAAIGTAQQKYDVLRAQVEEARTKLTEDRIHREQLGRDIDAAAQSIESIRHRILQIEEKISSVADEQEACARTIGNLTSELEAAAHADETDMSADDIGQQETELESQLGDAREREVAAQIAWNESDRKYRSLQRQAVLLRDNAEQAAARRKRIAEQNSRYSQKAYKAAQISHLAAEAARLLHTQLERVARRREELQSQVSSHDEALTRLRNIRNSLEPQVDALSRKERDSDVQRERVAAQLGQITQKVLDDLGLTVDGLLRSYGPALPVPVLDDAGIPVPLAPDSSDIPGSSAARSDPADDDPDGRDTAEVPSGTAFDPSDADYIRSHFKTVEYNRSEQEKRLAKAQRDLAALGKVNPLATEEYDALQTRHQYLSQQRNDVVSSRNDVMKLIRSLDATMIEVFREAFEDTAQAFEKVFATLFPGGTGRLRLDDPEDLLSTGVIVEASPAGKRVKQLTLLSGGERSLTALALLFAIFTARPSPFYILDEVEAALDDINLTRLLNALNDLRMRSQLIIITHQQRTMSIADVLYGVTMRSDGVTAVVSQKLKQGSMQLDGPADS